MIDGEDIYKVVTAMAPLYLALVLGYASVKWWHMFKPDHCDAINRFTCYFILPFFTFEFISHVNPYKMNFRFVAADVIAKAIIGIGIGLWAICSKKRSFCWSITTFSLGFSNNSLVLGVPLLKAMYGNLGNDLVVQSYVIQALFWITALLFMLELRRAISEAKVKPINGNSPPHAQVEITIRGGTINGDSQGEAEMRRDLEETTTNTTVAYKPPSFWSTMKIVAVKLAKNPNFFSCMIGLIWALLANRWHFQMPEIVEGSILIMSKAGSGVAMFTTGLFMALQPKIIACGVALTLYGMVLRFVIGPATMAIGSVATGLRGDVLRIAIVQAALPQSVASFVYAIEYGLHPDVISTAVTFGTLVSLPLLIGYYAALDLLH